MSPETDQKLAEARAIRDELHAAAMQLRRMETQAGMGGQDLSVRVKDPDWLIGLMNRAAAALEVRIRCALAAENARLLVAFHDAIRRPLGVTPDSGAEFYDPRMADEAEARRAGRVVLRELDPEEAAARAAALADARRREKRGGGDAG